MMGRSWVFEWFGVRPLDLIQSRIKFMSLWRWRTSVISSTGQKGRITIYISFCIGNKPVACKCEGIGLT